MSKVRGGGWAVAISLALHGLAATILVGQAPIERFEPRGLEVSLVTGVPRRVREAPVSAPKASPAADRAAPPSPERPGAAPVTEGVADAAGDGEAPPRAAPALVGDPASAPPIRTPALASAATIYARVVWERVNARRPATAPGAGIARVTFRLDRSGKLVSLALGTSSGWPAFDRSAMASVRSASPFPPPPQGLTDDDLLFELEVRSRTETAALSPG